MWSWAASSGRNLRNLLPFQDKPPLTMTERRFLTMPRLSATRQAIVILQKKV